MTQGDGRPTAGVVVIGNEILSGKVSEQNVAFFVERFRALGVKLCRVAIVADEVPEIAATVRAFSDRFEIVCTTGGVGPTHDDVTIRAVAQAFGLPVVEHLGLADRIREHLGERVTSGHLRMARVPEGAELVGGKRHAWPTIRIRNIYIFPGVPSLCRAKFADLEEHFAGRPVYLGILHLEVEEALICAELDAWVARFPELDVGSYPVYEGGRSSVRLTVECGDEELARRAYRDLKGSFPFQVLSDEPPRAIGGGTNE
jgi:molybdenum cofactor synthesis domain-containing protein